MTEASTGPGPGSRYRTALPSGPVWQAGLLAALAATAVNALAWLVIQRLIGADLQIPVRPDSTELQDLPLWSVVVITLLTGLLGAAALWPLSRLGLRGVDLWTILAGVFAALSGLPILNVDVGQGRQLGLFVFHLLAGATMIAVVRRRLVPRDQ
jgi:Family of unknown function (DUF6069)